MKRINIAEAALDEKLQGKPLAMSKYELAGGAWSFSKLKVLEKCAYQFYLKYILKVAGSGDTDRSMANIGTTAHRILELIMMGRSIGDSFLTTHRELVVDSPMLSQQQWDDSIVPLEMNIMAFKERMDNFHRNYKVESVKTEFRVAVTADWRPTTFFAKDVYIRGIVDLVLFVAGGNSLDAIIIDHKHGGGEFGGIQNYQVQLDGYKPLLHYGVRKVTGAQAGVNFVKAGRLVMGDLDTKDEIEGKLRGRFEWLLEGAIDSVYETKRFKHIASNYCAYCDYKAECKAGQLKEHEMTTAKRIPIIPIQHVR